MVRRLLSPRSTRSPGPRHGHQNRIDRGTIGRRAASAVKEHNVGSHSKPPAPNPEPKKPSPRDADGQHPDVSKPGSGTHKK